MPTETSSIALIDDMPIVALPAAVPASPRRKPASARRPSRSQPHRPVIISEELFKGVLMQERTVAEGRERGRECGFRAAFGLHRAPCI